MTQKFFRPHLHNLRQVGVTATALAKFYNMPKDTAVRIYPTASGTATVYTTLTPASISDDDDTASKVAASTNAEWDAWEAGAVTTKTTNIALGAAEVVALAVSSGTWVIELLADESV